MLNGKDHLLITDENACVCLAAISVLGDREEQQDSFGYRLKQDEGLVLICDGMGGHEGGQQASKLAVDTFLESYEIQNPNTSQSDMLVVAAKRADDSISQIKRSDGSPLKAGTTVVSVLIDHRKLMWCSAGDSRAYLLRDGEMVQLTHDHNYRSVLIAKMKAGQLDSVQFEKENSRGEALISYLGIGNLSLIDHSETAFDLQKDDKILLASDGLYKVVSEPEIARILDNFSNISEAVQALEMKAKRNAKSSKKLRDNMTVALIKVK